MLAVISQTYIYTKIFYCTSFNGHYPVGAAAVVSAADSFQAAGILERELEKVGLKQDINPNTMIPMHDKPVVILQDGNY